jgi:hypothetical protein
MFGLKQVGLALVLGVSILAVTVLTRAADQTFQGVVTDFMCGLTHKMADAKACTNACAKNGGYALLIGSKVFKLEGNTAALADLAAERVQVKGTMSQDKITITSVEKAN